MSSQEFSQPSGSPTRSDAATAPDDPPTPDYEDLRRNIETYAPEALDRLLTKLADRSTESTRPPQTEPPAEPPLSKILTQQLLTVFPHACPEYAASEVTNYLAEFDNSSSSIALEDIDLEPLVNRWLVNGYRKRVKKWQQQQNNQQGAQSTSAREDAEQLEGADPDEGTMFDWRHRMHDFRMRQPVFDALASEFPLVSKRSLSQVVKAFKYCLPAAYRFIYKFLTFSGQLCLPIGSNLTRPASINLSEATASAAAAGDDSLDYHKLPFDCPHQVTLISESNDSTATSSSSAVGSVSRKLSSELNESHPELMAELRFVRGLLADQMSTVESEDTSISLSGPPMDDASVKADRNSNPSASTIPKSLAGVSPSPAANFECECCLGEFQFDAMCQCPEGHLFCRPCLAAYVKEKVFGIGRSALQCMSPNCEQVFLRSQLCLAVDDATLTRLDERAAEDSVRSISRLFRCPACNWGAEIDDATDDVAAASASADGAADAGADAGPSRSSNKVFTCLNCEKEVCRLCGVDWEDHFGKRCSEIECDIETKLRREFEERMTEARVRICYQCNASVMKTSGCNHITCRCGAHFCYICRGALPPQNPYSHFCNHGHPAGADSCIQGCNRCPVQSSTEQDERRAISELRAQGLKRQREEGFQERPIGPDQQETAAKRSRQS